MKITTTLPLVIALAFSTSVFSQSDATKAAAPHAMGSMNMKHMEMADCPHMKGMDMKNMDMAGMNMNGMDMKNMDAKKCKEMMGKMKKGNAAAHAGTHSADGVVTAIDPAGKVTLKHGAVATLGWPAMTMGFTVKDKTLMEKLSVGRKVHFEFKQEGKDYVITSAK